MGIHVCVGVHVLAQTGLTKYNLMSTFCSAAEGENVYMCMYIFSKPLRVL